MTFLPLQTKSFWKFHIPSSPFVDTLLLSSKKFFGDDSRSLAVFCLKSFESFITGRFLLFLFYGSFRQSVHRIIPPHQLFVSLLGSSLGSGPWVIDILQIYILSLYLTCPKNISSRSYLIQFRSRVFVCYLQSREGKIFRKFSRFLSNKNTPFLSSMRFFIYLYSMFILLLYGVFCPVHPYFWYYRCTYI